MLAEIAVNPTTTQLDVSKIDVVTAHSEEAPEDAERFFFSEGILAQITSGLN